jgi:hypothetical protein
MYVKVQLCLYTPWSLVGEWKYSSTHSKPRHWWGLMRIMPWQFHHQGGGSALPPLVPIEHEAGPQCRSGQTWEENHLLPLPEIEPWFHSCPDGVAKYTAHAVPAGTKDKEDDNVRIQVRGKLLREDPEQGNWILSTKMIFLAPLFWLF